MKKIIMLAIVLTTIAGSAFSNSPDAVTQKVLNSFSKNFRNAEDVQWNIKKDLYKATFKINGEVMFAYYREDGEQVAISRNITPSQLSLSLSSELKSGYNEYWLTELFEVVTNGETAYYATVETADHVTLLKANGSNSGWATFKKDRKK